MIVGVLSEATRSHDLFATPRTYQAIPMPRRR
jgi:hypothetical protein